MDVASNASSDTGQPPGDWEGCAGLTAGLFQWRIVAMGFILLVCLLGLSADAQTLDDSIAEELRDLEGMRRGLETPADKVEARGAELLSRYTAEGQQALIHYQLARVHAQSGQTHPKLVVEHSLKALALPLDSVRRLQLQIYHGDALQLMNRERPAEEAVPFAELRRAAAKVYLEGLKEAKQYNIPDERPELPVRERPFEIPRGSGAEYEAKVRKSIEEEKVFSAAMEEARRMQALWDNRRVLRGQFADMYARPPSASAELEELTVRILEEPESAATFRKAVEESPRRRLAAAANTSRNEEQKGVPMTAPKRNWRMIGGVNLAILIGAYVGFRLWRSMRKVDGH